MADLSAASAAHELVVDRFEGDFAVVEVDGAAPIDLPRWLLPQGAREGDVVRARITPGAGGVRVDLRVDEEETARRRATVSERLQRLQSRDPGGDIQL